MGKAGASVGGGMVLVEELGEIEKEREGENEMRKNGCSTGVIRWESILHRMFIRVMLVEADDSTRQIIAALLRRCGYQVAAIPDGLKAWETLKGRPHSIDLILTEVELPSVSGFDLLTMIMEHEICKSIPVIMMSSHDSMGMIFNCMLRGAADFLVKPVRKNELSNLWQHVWRRQSSAGHSHGPKDRSLAQQRIEATSENKASSNRSSSYVAAGQKDKDCSEKESDTHSTCTKPNVEAESVSVHIMRDFLLPVTSLLSDTKLQKHGESIKLGEKIPAQNIQEDESIKFEHKGTTCNDDISSVELVVEHDSSETMIWGNDVAEDSHKEEGKICGESKEDNLGHVEVSTEAIDLIGTFDNIPHVYKAVVQKDFCNIAKTHLDSIDVSNKLNSNLLLELSLRRSHHSDHGNQHSDRRNTLNHSNASAFSWYTNRTVQPVSSHAERAECEDDLPKYILNQDPINPTDASESNATALEKDQGEVFPVIHVPDQAQATEPCPHLGVVPLPVLVRSIVVESSQSGYGAVLPPMFYAQAGLPQSLSPNSASQQGSTFDVKSCRPTNPETHKADQCRPLHGQNASSSTEHSEQLHQSLESGENMVRISPGTGQSGTTSLHDGAASHLNSNECGSICNGRIENVTPTAVVRRTILENGKSEGLLIHDGTRMNPHRSTQREAALNKFRLKRKDRCYEKKVRYESRQKLAEQRPRVKGQFVRQVSVNSPLQ